MLCDQALFKSILYSTEEGIHIQYIQISFGHKAFEMPHLPGAHGLLL